MPPEHPLPDRVPPRIERGVSARLRRRGLFKPQHRVVLFLLAASAGSFLLTILFPPPQEGEETQAAGAGAAVPMGELVFPRERGAFVSLVPPEETVPEPLAEGGNLVAAAQALAPELSACAAAHAAALVPLDGRLVVRAEVGASGLQRADLVDVAEADPAAVACLAAATWGLRWPVRDPPERVSVPFYVVAPLESESGGSAAATAPEPTGER